MSKSTFPTHVGGLSIYRYLGASSRDFPRMRGGLSANAGCLHDPFAFSPHARGFISESAHSWFIEGDTKACRIGIEMIGRNQS